MDVRKWIIDARAGDRDAFCRVYGLYRVRLYRFAYYRLGNAADAEDAVSECVLSAWRQIGNLREPDAFQAWIFRILAACCNTLIRQQIKRRDQVSLDAAGSGDGYLSSSQTGGGTLVSAGSSSPAASAGSVDAPKAGRALSDPALQTSEQTDLRLALQESLDRLEEADRQIVLLAAVGGLKSAEIGELMEMPAGTVRSRLSRSLKKVRGYLE